MTKLLLATNNKGKVLEYRSLLQGLPFELVTPAMAGLRLEVAETGSTFTENARLKALAFAQASRLMTLADDSGLEVDALNGEPGIRSSRYAGEGANDRDRVIFLLDKLKDVPREKRTAHFTCVIALVLPDSSLRFCTGECHGLIAFEPRGNQGFGYDPIFYFPDLQKTLAELPPDIKNSLSHRARAAQKACEILKKLEYDNLPHSVL
jgi:XTP/dITP diphosphohydrolase